MPRKIRYEARNAQRYLYRKKTKYRDMFIYKGKFIKNTRTEEKEIILFPIISHKE